VSSAAGLVALSLLGMVLGCDERVFTGDDPTDTGGASLGGEGGALLPAMRPLAGRDGRGGGGSAGDSSGVGGDSETGSNGGEPGAGDGGQGGDGSLQPPSECPCAAPKPSCVAGKCVARGPTMVKAGPIYIDSTEVTVAQYQAFMMAKGDDVTGQAAECSWNDSFVPSAAQSSASHPITSVDFCDAVAFCAWADKKLCGQLGGGKLAIDDAPVAAKSEWFQACGGPKGQPFPYGTSHVDGACNDATGAGAIAPVRTFPGCTGVYVGLFDMVGNVAEWIDACDATNNGWDGCETIGGTFADDNPCSGSGLRHRDEKDPSVGFRCCSQ
jgi:formylglycine-generating enzyme